MFFRARRDAFFTNLIITIIVFIGLILFLPYIDGLILSLNYLIFSIVVLILCSIFIIWQIRDIKYVFYNDYLLVKGGLFKSKIPYDAITQINPTKNWWIGYRVISAKSHLLEIHYKTGWFGSVIISPEDKQGFIEELQKRCGSQFKITE